MPVILITDRDSRKAGTPAQVDDIVRLACALMNALSPHFRPGRFRLWKHFPGEGLGGELILKEDRAVSVTQLASSAPTPEVIERGPDAKPLVSGGLQPFHVLEITGRFQWSGLPSVPAFLDVNLYPPWATEVGDVVFDTTRTGRTRADGLYSLIASPRTERDVFVRRVMNEIVTSRRRLKSASLKWAGVKATESVDVDAPGACYAWFDHRQKPIEFPSSRLLVEQLRDDVLREPDFDSSLRHFSEPVIRDIVESLTTQLSDSNGYRELISGILRDEGISVETVGSALFFAKEEGSVDGIARSLRPLLSGHLRGILRARINEALGLDRYLERLALERKRAATSSKLA